MTALVHTAEWQQDCQFYWGYLLTGNYAHWCPEWDELPIDETCITEFEACGCFRRAE